MRNKENMAERGTHIFIKGIFSTPQDSILAVYGMDSSSKLTPRPRSGVAAEDTFVEVDSFISVMQMVNILETMAEADVTEPVSLASCESFPLSSC